MIANFFEKSKPATIFQVILLLYIFFFISTYTLNFGEISAVLIIKRVVLFCWHLFLLFVINLIVRRSGLTQNNSYVLLLVVLFLGMFSEPLFSSKILFANITLLLGFSRLYGIKPSSNDKSILFDIGLWVGISTIIYSWSIVYLLLIYVGISVFKKVSARNLLIPIVGFLTPILLGLAYLFFIDSFSNIQDYFSFDISLSFTNYNPLKIVVPISVLLVILLWSIAIVTPKVVMVSNHLRLLWIVLLNHLLLSALIIVISPIKNGSEMFFLIFPAAVVVTNFLQKSESSTSKNIILYLFLGIALSVYFL